MQRSGSQQEEIRLGSCEWDYFGNYKLCMQPYDKENAEKQSKDSKKLIRYAKFASQVITVKFTNDSLI